MKGDIEYKLESLANGILSFGELIVCTGNGVDT